MPFPRRSALLAAMFAGCVCLPGCGGGDEGAREAPGAPIRVPNLSRPRGRPLSQVQPALVEEIRKSCGGRICVNVVIKHVKRSVHPAFAHRGGEGCDGGACAAPPAERAGGPAGYCQYVEIEPPPGTPIRPGSTIYIIAGAEDPRPCGVPETVTAEPVAPPRAPSEGTPAPTEATPTEESPTEESPTEESPSEESPSEEVPGPTEDSPPGPPQEPGPPPEPGPQPGEEPS